MKFIELKLGFPLTGLLSFYVTPREHGVWFGVFGFSKEKWKKKGANKLCVDCGPHGVPDWYSRRI
jgi:hypothetical protein